MTTKIKRSQVKTFMNVTPDATATYELLSDGVTTGTINYNPSVTTETYIGDDNATIDVETYAPNMPIEASAKSGDAVFEFVDGLRKSRATLSDAQTDVVNVWLYETPTAGEYPAEKQIVSIQIDSFGGDGGTAAKLNFTINYIGDPIPGMFDPADNSFTPD
jgi:hypothetical protein